MRKTKRILASIGIIGILSATTMAAEKVTPSPLALNGFSPVSILDGKKWVKGATEYSSVFDRRKYRFPTAKEQQQFETDSQRYAPALNGDCVVSYVNSGKRVAGHIQYAMYYENRLYLFPSEIQKEIFTANPALFVKADLAFGGQRAICAIDADKDVAGEKKFTAQHDGLQYRFPNGDLLAKFEATPEKYVVTSDVGKKAAAKGLITVTGTTACAVCDYGVSPLQHPDKLGMVVVAKNGTIYVVEAAHEQFPKLYYDRFDALTVTISGKELKRSGQFVWMAPRQVRILNK